MDCQRQYSASETGSRTISRNSRTDQGKARDSQLMCKIMLLFLNFCVSLAIPILLVSNATTEITALQLQGQTRVRPFMQRKYRKLDQEEEEARVRAKVETSGLPSRGNKARQRKIPVTNIHQLQHQVLIEGRELKDLSNQMIESQVTNFLDHDVIQLLSNRFNSGSTPLNRNDPHKLALCIEGGGMRGAVSAGMAAAIGSLGLCDAIDVIYGSSAGSVVGAYMVSQQMCVDVYTEVLTAAKEKFVCKKRLMASIAASAADMYLGSNMQALPGMNISFVLDGIMNETTGLRPLDIEAFRRNDAVQPLRVASSCVNDGKLMTKCFGTEDFFGVPNVTEACSSLDRIGLFACLEASMTVPGATGPPVDIYDPYTNTTVPSFDAFCFEPLPYRSAVKEGATHVLVLRSRPEGFQAKTQPGIYERGVAPLYFHNHRLDKVAQFFDRGGQQYIYLEDLMTLEDGKNCKSGGEGIRVPPPEVFYGTDDVRRDPSQYTKAHVFPIVVPRGTKELPTLEQGKDEVLEAVRGGFAAAFDILAPAVGLHLGVSGRRVSELVFPKMNFPEEDVLAHPCTVQGMALDLPRPLNQPRKTKILNKLTHFWGFRPLTPLSSPQAPLLYPCKVEGSCDQQDAHTLLMNLPGIQSGRLEALSDGLRFTRAQS